MQDADRWLQAQGNASPYQIAGGADVQNWDPSVKALTAFPQVLAEMDRNIRWGSDLGNASYKQRQDVVGAGRGVGAVRSEDGRGSMRSGQAAGDASCH